MNARKTWKWGCLILVLLMLAGGGMLAMIALLAQKHGATGKLPLNRDRIAVVRIEDVLVNADKIVERLVDLRQDASVKGILLRIDSPGGGVVVAQEIYEEVRACRDAEKVIVASLGSVAASGGYYIAVAADTIVANPGTITGSIGVIFEFPYFQDLMKKVGVELEVVKSGKYKDAGGAHRKMTGEERALFQGVIDDTWEQFVNVVAEERGMSIEKVKPLADGRIFTGRQAAALGLVDILGTFEDAKSLTKAMAGLPEDAEVYEFQRPRRLADWLFGEPAELLKWQRSLLPGGLNYLFTR
ncbi:MAG: signal peptide peptidase SppA [Fibrobacterota bacterium]